MPAILTGNDALLYAERVHGSVTIGEVITASPERARAILAAAGEGDRERVLASVTVVVLGRGDQR